MVVSNMVPPESLTPSTKDEDFFHFIQFSNGVDFLNPNRDHAVAHRFESPIIGMNYEVIGKSIIGNDPSQRFYDSDRGVTFSAIPL